MQIRELHFYPRTSLIKIVYRVHYHRTEDSSHPVRVMSQYQHLNLEIDADDYRDGINTLVKHLKTTWDVKTTKVEASASNNEQIKKHETSF